MIKVGNMNIEKYILNKAKAKNKTIVFPEADFSPRIIEGAKTIVKKKIAKVILLGDESSLDLKYGTLEGMQIINPKTSSLKDEFTKTLYEIMN